MLDKSVLIKSAEGTWSQTLDVSGLMEDSKMFVVDDETSDTVLSWVGTQSFDTVTSFQTIWFEITDGETWIADAFSDTPDDTIALEADDWIEISYELRRLELCIEAGWDLKQIEHKARVLQSLEKWPFRR